MDSYKQQIRQLKYCQNESSTISVNSRESIALLKKMIIKNNNLGNLIF